MRCHAGPQGDVRRSLSSVRRWLRMRNALELVEVDSDRLEEVLRRAEQSLDEKDAALIRAVFESYAYVTELVEDKNTSIRRLRQLFFGKRTEKTAAVVGEKAEDSDAPSECAAAAETGLDAEVQNPAESSESDEAAASKGHGRHGADAYRGASRIAVRHPSLAAGDACPACGQGTVYEKAPGVLVRIIGQPPLGATVYELQKLRCHLCGEVFTAPAPVEAGEKKYDATAGSMIGLLKYGSGLPFTARERPVEACTGQRRIPRNAAPAAHRWRLARGSQRQDIRGTRPVERPDPRGGRRGWLGGYRSCGRRGAARVRGFRLVAHEAGRPRAGIAPARRSDRSATPIRSPSSRRSTTASPCSSRAMSTSNTRIEVWRYMAGWPTKIEGQTLPISGTLVPGQQYAAFSTARAHRRRGRDHRLEFSVPARHLEDARRRSPLAAPWC